MSPESEVPSRTSGQAVTDAKSTCQACGGKLIPIIYGLPSPAMFRAAQKDQIILGGCVETSNNPHWKCQGCGKDFGPA